MKRVVNVGSSLSCSVSLIDLHPPKSQCLTLQLVLSVPTIIHIIKNRKSLLRCRVSEDFIDKILLRSYNRHLAGYGAPGAFMNHSVNERQRPSSVNCSTHRLWYARSSVPWVSSV